uniref:Uncharacterized protein n=1 Tax=Candidatus Kentrum sp. TC TaxID=2126339 RepID=A0A451A292_9GAMM|nr:MAG: hypothetical protein BECKTC1821D_GA0114238_11575 [Candidatus Kentron sp. TC]VFK60158.1 MAG: hypothetical protein BECKTC1821F_GA0114240_10422 [Candidatus Kentron sp. TC]
MFSTFGFLLALLICEGIEPGYLSAFFAFDKGVVNTFGVFIMNLWADWFSLLETRWVLRRCARSRIGLPRWPGLDLIASYLIYLFIGVGFFGVLLGGLLTGHVFEGLYEFFTLDFHIRILSAFTEIKDLTAFLYSTFFTSFLFYIFLLFSLLIRLLVPVQFALLPFMAWLAISKHPLKSFVAGATAIAFLMEGLQRMGICAD